MGSGLGHCPAHRKTPPMHLPTPWPYPRWIAHRGAGLLAPENTLAAFAGAAPHGYGMFECDARLSRDGVPFLLHDPTLGRTTNSVQALGQAASRTGGDHRWSALSRLDAGAWHSPGYAGEPLPTLENLARYCIANGFFLNLEIKPTPGLSAKTGQVVGAYAARLWQGKPAQPLSSTFHPETLAGSLETAPHLPRPLLLDALWDGCLDCARQLGCAANVCHRSLWEPALVAQVNGQGMRTLSYTVNDEGAARRLIDLGTDAIITDRVDLFAPAAADRAPGSPAGLAVAGPDQNQT